MSSSSNSPDAVEKLTSTTLLFTVYVLCCARSSVNVVEAALSTAPVSSSVPPLLIRSSPAALDGFTVPLMVSVPPPSTVPCTISSRCEALEPPAATTPQSMISPARIVPNPLTVSPWLITLTVGSRRPPSSTTWPCWLTTDACTAAPGPTQRSPG